MSVFGAPGGRLVRKFDRPGTGVTAVAFVHPGTYLAWVETSDAEKPLANEFADASGGAVVCLADLRPRASTAGASGIAPIASFDSPVERMVATDQGKRIVLVTRDLRVVSSGASPTALRERAEGLTEEPLTPDEWSQYAGSRAPYPYK